MTAFVPRAVFPTLDSLPRSYYLGHHAAGLSKMRTMLSQVDFILECRDSRIPLTSRNPLFEENLAGRERMVVYTKRDLAGTGSAADTKRHDFLRKWHHPSKVVFSDHRNFKDTQRVLELVKEAASDRGALTGSFVMVVGMPNIGKSSLLNALRREGLGKGKAAHTGAQPGITRKVGTGVKIVEATEHGAGPVYLMDTPGVFMPFVPNADAMLKLALCGSVKDTIVPPFNLVDYLLYHMNLFDPAVYSEYSRPTNDATELLEVVARKTGRLQKGGMPDLDGTALWLVQRWRNGHLGRFTLDEVSTDAIEQYAAVESSRAASFNQARKAGKEAARAKSKVRKSDTTD